MKTASWFTYIGPGRVGISRGTPRGTRGGYKLFKPLCPDGDMLKMSETEYAPRYAAILSRLDPQATWDELHRLAGGAEPVLLCFEKPPFTPTNRCHRRRVADWFQEKLGHEVPEYSGPVDPALQPPPALF